MVSIVFKVKHEETLRRFNVAVNGGQRLDLSMEGLRRKICSLFNLPPEADFRLTYSDEDNDLVTLVEDEDLHDVVAQGLNPVRITVHLKSEKSAETVTDASGNSTLPASAQNPQPNISPNVAEVLKSVQEPLSQFLQKLGSSSQNLQQSTNPDVAEIVKSVQEPLTHALSKLSLEMSSKAASASPVLADLFDGLLKLGQSHLNASLSQSGAANLGSHDEFGNAVKLGSEGRSSDASVVEGIRNDVVSGLHPSQRVHKSTQATERGPPVRPPLSFSSYDKGKNASSDSSSEKSSFNGNMKNKKCGIESFAGKHGADWTAFGHSEEKPKSSKDTSAHNTGGSKFCGNTSRSYPEPILPAECPLSGIPVSGYGKKPQADRFFEQLLPSNRNQMDGFVSSFHKGVRCDGCGVLPITGPRFKSKVKYDFDLCRICFSRTENGADYIRIDFPLPYTPYRHCWSSRISDAVSRLPVVSDPYMPRGRGAKHHRTRLDSRFIMDVNVVDGTTMPPSTPFTKIWRMRNNGTLPWNRGLQLLWIGGDRFSSFDSVEIEVPVNGVQLGNELDIAVEFVAPELPGRYTSYWRMAEPSGHKFGQRVWVQIQVDASMDLTRESTPILNLNLPPDNHDQAADVTAELEIFLETGDASGAVFEENSKVELGSLTFPTNDDLLVPTDVARPSSTSASPSVQSAASFHIPASLIGTYVPCPVVEIPPDNRPAAVPVASVPFTSMIEPSGASSNAKDGATNPEVNSHMEQASEKSEVEDNLLNELEQMGFKQIDLNKEVLRMNEYDLERSVDELCGVSEWDPILEELKEMGFEDKETNKKLLAKNNGSITRVVMDLIAEEKA